MWVARTTDDSMLVSPETGEAVKASERWQRDHAILDNMFAVCPYRHLSHRVRPTDVHWMVPCWSCHVGCEVPCPAQQATSVKVARLKNTGELERAHGDLHKIAVHAGTKAPRWSEFHHEGADDVARTGTDLISVRKFLGLSTDVFLKHSLNFKQKLKGRCPLVGRVVMVCRRCRLPRSWPPETNMRMTLKASVRQSRADGRRMKKRGRQPLCQKLDTVIGKIVAGEVQRLELCKEVQCWRKTAHLLCGPTAAGEPR